MNYASSNGGTGKGVYTKMYSPHLSHDGKTDLLYRRLHIYHLVLAVIGLQ